MKKLAYNYILKKKKDNGIPPYYFMEDREGNVEVVTDLLFLCSKIPAVCKFKSIVLINTDILFPVAC